MYITHEEFRHREREMMEYFRHKEQQMAEHIRYLENREEYYHKSNEQILEEMDIKDIEKFLRRKKLNNLKK